MDEQKGNNNRKISDFFKTPDKQVEKQKQKNLLQFFTKSSQIGVADENVDESNVAFVEDMNLTGTEITMPTSSDKENVEVHEDNLVAGDKEESKTKANKNQKTERDSESSDDESGFDKSKLKHSGNESEKTEVKRQKKHKQKRKPRDDRANNTLSNSIILLSDSSLSNPPNTDCNHGCKMEAYQSVDTMDVDDKSETEKCIELADKTESENGAQNDNKTVEVDTVGITGNEIENIGNTGIHEKHKKKRNKNIEVKEKNLKFELLNSGTGKVKQTDEEMSNIVDSKGCDKDPVEQPKHEKRKSKKSALKGKDMLNLLKEIQSVESEDCKKKKHHKKKHKHKKEKLQTEVFEIAVSEDNYDGKDCAVKETRDLKNDICDKKGSGSENPTESNNEKTETDGVGKSKNGKSKKSKFVFNREGAINGKLTETEKESKKVKKDKLKKKKHQGKEETTIAGVSCVPDNIHELSYTIFSKKLTSSKSGTNDDKKCDSAKEMSYTEYLQLMEKSHNDDDVDICDTDVEVVNVEDTERIAHRNKNVQKNYVGSGKDILEGECKVFNSTMKKFFTAMTSTPDKEKKDTKLDKMLGKEIVENVRKSKKNSKVRKDKTKKKETDCEIIESNSDILINRKTNNCKMDTVDTRIEIEKVDTPAKCLFSGKKTQATLSFGKTGLTVSKSETRIEDDLPIETDEPSNKCNKKSKTNYNILKSVHVKTKNAKKIVRQSRKDTVFLNSTDSSVFATPDKPKRRKGKRKIDVDVDSESTDSADRRRSLRKRYKVEGFQMDADMKTPIKIKLRR